MTFNSYVSFLMMSWGLPKELAEKQARKNLNEFGAKL